jgi:hypothetical protein
MGILATWAAVLYLRKDQDGSVEEQRKVTYAIRALAVAGKAWSLLLENLNFKFS